MSAHAPRFRSTSNGTDCSNAGDCTLLTGIMRSRFPERSAPGLGKPCGRWHPPGSYVNDNHPDDTSLEPCAERRKPNRRARTFEVIRYLVVGGFNTIFGYGSFALLTYLMTGHLPYPYMFANVIASVASITVAFIGYKYFVFRTKGNFLREYLRTYMVYGTSILLGLVLLPVLVFALGFVIRRANLVPYVAQAICTLLVIFGSYVGHKKFSFRR